MNKNVENGLFYAIMASCMADTYRELFKALCFEYQEAKNER